VLFSTYKYESIIANYQARATPQKYICWGRGTIGDGVASLGGRG